jgi:hypothetical protein
MRALHGRLKEIDKGVGRVRLEHLIQLCQFVFHIYAFELVLIDVQIVHHTVHTLQMGLLLPLGVRRSHVPHALTCSFCSAAI